MAVTFTSSSARKAGKSKTPAKRASSRKNGRLGATDGIKGGAPRTSALAEEVRQIMATQDVSRPTAYKIAKSDKGRTVTR